MTHEPDGERIADARTIDTSDNYALRYWAGRFGCSVAEIKSAAAAVGPDVASVHAHLNDNSPTPIWTDPLPDYD